MPRPKSDRKPVTFKLPQDVRGKLSDLAYLETEWNTTEALVRAVRRAFDALTAEDLALINERREWDLRQNQGNPA